MPLGDYLAVLRRRGWIIPLVALVAVAAAVLFSRVQAPVYRSTVMLEVSGRFDYGAQLTVERQLSPLAQRMMTTETAAEVDRRLKLDLGAQTLLTRVRAVPVAENVQIQVDVDDGDQQRAELVAREFARVYEEQHAARELGKPVSERTNVTMLDRPSSASQVWPQTRTFAVAAGLLGLLVGTVLAFVLDFLDNTLKTASDVERHVGLTTLGVVPLWARASTSTTAGRGATALAAVRRPR
jgi:capsular polysaccharide biosynthesis protein